MTTNRLQLVLIPELGAKAQPQTPPAVASPTECIELMAMMLVRLVRGRHVSDDHEAEVCDEPR